MPAAPSIIELGVYLHHRLQLEGYGHILRLDGSHALREGEKIAAHQINEHLNEPLI
jgi:hypothetical protein